jgi:DMSO/TMAO reductase YedYZ molybdopterin-dependent catalytic subunit
MSGRSFEPGSSQDPSALEGGSPVGRRVVLGMLGLAGVGVVLGSRIGSAISTLAERDPTGLTGLLPGNGRFRYYSVVSGVDEIASEAYTLAIEGSGGTVHLTFDQLAALPQTTVTRDVQCVTGWRVPAVTWSGVRLSDVLAHLGSAPTRGAVMFGSADGAYTESLTVEQAMRPDVLVATAMDGAPITHDHGGPVRLYVAPMYFYKSLKWLDRITLGDTVEPGYWEQRGYDIDAWVGSSNGRDDAPVA